MKFNEAVEIILFHEGGYVFHPRDPGGETNFGISKRAYPNTDIKNLTREQAIEIYRKDYWEKPGVEKMPECLRLLVFDAAVNQGPGAAIGLLQSAIGVKVTGVVTDEMLTKLEALPMADVIKKYVYFRWRRYAEHKRFIDFGAGWGKRLLDVSLECTLRTPPKLPLP